VGNRKIGVSLSDPTFSITQGLKVYKRNSKKNDIKAFKEIVKEYEIAEIVIGLPKDLNGSLGKKHIAFPVVYRDEKYSMNEVCRIFDMAEINKKMKAISDVMASQIILQG
jgi:putative Holliday junction resolvase